MQNLTPDRRLYRLATALPPRDVQNRLMRITDRELAISMLYLDDSERRVMLGFLGRVKRDRVTQELSYVQHLRLRYPQYRRVIEQVIAFLSGRSDGSVRSYIRPIRD